jgi:hypothetical protein
MLFYKKIVCFTKIDAAHQPDLNGFCAGLPGPAAQVFVFRPESARGISEEKCRFAIRGDESAI